MFCNTWSEKQFYFRQMTYTTISNNFLITDLDNIQLINMPSQFTAREVNELRQSLSTFEQLAVTSNDLNIKKIVVNFEKTISRQLELNIR